MAKPSVCGPAKQILGGLIIDKMMTHVKLGAFAPLCSASLASGAGLAHMYPNLYLGFISLYMYKATTVCYG